MCGVLIALLTAGNAGAQTSDFGDHSSFSSASSTVVTTIRIGATTDKESAATTNATATGDDITGSDDEDGVTVPANLIQGVSSSIVVNVTNTSGATVYLNAWIDFNRNGSLTDTGEQIATNTTIATGTSNSSRTLTFTTPAGASLGSAGVRVRLTSVTSPGPTGADGNGEVEDYVTTIVQATDTGDYNGFATATSLMNSNLRIGATVDAEVTGTSNSTATGDDTTGSDDEDGVTVPASVVQGTSSSLTVNVTNTSGASGFLNAWIDFNDNGVLTDSGEQIATNTAISTGTSNSNRTLSFTVPSNAAIGPVGVRVRLTSTSSPGSTGTSGTGEVEDYVMQITCPTISLSPSTLGSGTVGLAYSATLSASGGNAPYTYARTSGSLPAGLTLSSSGVLSGTPTGTYSSSFTVTATDANGCTGSQAVSVTISNPTTDFGDDSAFASASSTVNSNLRIGATVDAEAVATTDSTATGDDTTGSDDEDGVTLPAQLMLGAASTITVNVTNTSGATAYLNAWIDYNNNGTLTDSGEQIATNTVIATGTSNSNRTLSFTVPASAVTGTVGVRVRLTSVSSPGPTGADGNGEVEDHSVTISPNLSIGNMVWNDANENGLFDPGESGINNVLIELWRPGADDAIGGTGSNADTKVASMNTANGGLYNFNGLAAGTYYVKVPTPPLSRTSLVVDTNDNGEDGDNNGSQPGGSSTSVYSPIIDLASGTEPGSTGSGNLENTIDFGFASNIGSPFVCDNRFWVIQNAETSAGSGEFDSTLYYVGDDRDLVPVFVFTGYKLNGLAAYGGYLYCVDQVGNHLYRINSLGTLVDMGAIAGLPEPGSNGQWSGATALTSGLMILNLYTWSPSASTKLYTIDLTSATLVGSGVTVTNTGTGTTYAGNFGDIVWDPLTGKVYGYSTVDTNWLGLFEINTTTGASTRVSSSTPGSWGSMIIDANGLTYGFGSAGASGAQDTLYVFNRTNGVLNGSITAVGTGPAVSNSDGAACPGAPPSMKLGNQVWNDVDNDGIKEAGEAGIDGVTLQLFFGGQNPLTAAPITSVTTTGGGFYSFNNLSPGQYFVYIPNPPAAYPLSSVPTTSTDNSVDNDDNGIQTAKGQAVRSPLIGLTGGLESITDGDTDVNSDMTVDFGFLMPTADYGDHSSFSGASQLASTNIRIGTNPTDAEGTTPTAANAAGDDSTDTDDEDLTMPSVVSGGEATLSIPVTLSGGLTLGRIGVWADWNGDNDVSDANEIVTLSSSGLIDGTNTITATFNPPAGTSAGTKYLRIRVVEGTTAPAFSGNSSLRGEVEDYAISVTAPTLDYGDLPDTIIGTSAGNYQTLSNDNGPTHTANTSLRLGSSVDAEGNGQPNSTATGDGSDDDGVASLPTLTQNLATTLTITATNSTGAAAFLKAWIDWNNDGNLTADEELGSQISVPTGTSNGSFSFNFTVPGTAVPGTPLGLRVRLGSVTIPAATGFAGTGEVEDYLVTVNASTSDFGDYASFAPASRVASSQIRIGTAATDAEASTLSSASANGDDSTGTDDEDLTMPALTSGTNGTLSISVTLTSPVTTGRIGVWADWNGDNDVLDTNETVTLSTNALVTGTNTITATLSPPAGTTGGPKYLRIIAQEGTTAPTFSGSSNLRGEVEDYAVNVTAYTLDFGDLPDTGTGTGTGNYQTLNSDSGPSHTATSTTLRLGSTVDVEADGQQNATATGDGADEDGITSMPVFYRGQGYTIPVSVFNNTGSTARIFGFIDWNNDGDFADSGETLTAVTVNSSASQQTINITGTTPGTATIGTFGARFRLATATTLGSTGTTANGEVEDYMVTGSCPTLSITPASLSATTQYSSYNQTLTATGGSAPYTWTITTGAIPGGLSMSGAGVFSGNVVSASGAYVFTARATDANGCSATKSYTISVGSGGMSVGNLVFLDENNNGLRDADERGIPNVPVEIWSVGADGRVNTADDQAVTYGTASTLSTGGMMTLGTFGSITAGYSTLTARSDWTGAYQFTELPTGVYYLKLTPPNKTVFSSRFGSGTTTYSLNLDFPLASSGHVLNDNGIDDDSNGVQTAGSFASSADAVVAGVGAAVFSMPFTLATATEPGTSNEGSDEYTLDFGLRPCPAIRITPITLPAVSSGVSYSSSLSASGGVSPYTYAITQGSLPAGLSLSTSGTISGTTSTTGTSAITVRATDARGCQGFTTIQVNVTSAMSITTASLPNGTEGTAYTSTTLAATGGTTPYQNWRISSGTVPPGLAINSSTGVLSGTPTSTGTYSFTVAVDDALVTPASVTVTNGSVETDSWSAATFVPRTSITGWTLGNSTLTGTTSAVQLYGINNSSNSIYGDTPAGSQYLASPFVGSWASQTVSGFSVGRPYTLRVRYAMRGAFAHPATSEAQPPFYGDYLWIAAYNGSAATLFGPVGANTPVSTSANFDNWSTLDIPFIPQASSMVFSYGLDGAAIDDVQFIPTTAATTTATRQFTIVISGNRDWGDLPDSGTGTGPGNYQTLSSDSGPSHYRNSNLRLGATLDIESDGQPTEDADGDDTNADDEDGIATLPVFERGRSFSIPVSVFNNTGTTARVFGFIDWNNDGDFLDPSEALSAVTVATGSSQQSVTMGGTVPGNAVLTQVGLRVRLSTAASLGAFGLAVNGEVEDYIATTTCPAIAVGPASLPAGTLSTAYSQTVAATGGTAPYTYTVTAGTLPSGVTLNASSGALAGTPNGAGTFNFTITATDANGCAGSSPYSVVMSCPVLAITPSTLTTGTVGTAYSQTLSASGGAAPYGSWTVISGTVPAGLTLNAGSGIISGTPTAGNGAGTTFTVRVTDANGCQGSQTVSLKICPVITLSPTTLAASTVNSSYSQTITASGGAAAYTYTLSSGTLPAGLTLNSSGTLSGIPTSTTSRTFTIAATDANGCSGSRSYTISPVCPTISITPAAAARATVGSVYSQSLAASGGVAPYSSWTVTSGTLPAGLSLNASTGVIGGTPTASNGAGVSVTIRTTDANGCTGSQAISLQVCPVVALSPSSLPNGTINTAYTQTLTASGGASPYTFTVSGGTLPAGLTLNSAGALTGTPTSTTAATFTITAADANGCTGSLAYTITPAPDSDFGDHSSFSSASSRMNSTLRIGALTDVEGSATTNATATGDDTTGSDDEDGVTLPASITQGAASSMTVNVTNTSGATAFLNVWIDFNQNGSLSDAGEQVATNTVIATGTSNSNRTISFTTPAGAALGSAGVRVRLTSVSSPGSTGASGNGEVEDHVANIVPPTTDYGDFSLFADAWSTGNANLKLGTVTDLEGSATKNAAATGDDITGSDDEDAITFPAMTAGQPMSLPVTVTNLTGATAYLNAWIDFNNNGVLTDAGEQIASNVSVITGLNGGTVTLNFTVPTNAVTAAALIGTRFRLTNVTTPGPTGGVGIGEVEDHGVTILAPLTDFGDFSGAPEVSNTASTNLRLGSLVDTEYAATTNAAATGDDSSGVDDEDGVTIPSMIAGAPATIPVVVSNNTGAAGHLNAWIDYNNNGVFTDPGEQIATNTSVPTGTTNSTLNLNITVPPAAVTGTNLGVRVRLSNDASPGSTGAGGIGEVEDYIVNIAAPTTDFGDYALFGSAVSTRNANLRLGATVDTEYAATTNATATGDDITGSDDEDGVTLPSMIAGAPATIPVVVTNNTGAAAFLNAWIDYNGNGVLTDAGEQIATNVSIATGTTNGTQNLNITVPTTTLTGVNLGVRVRLTSVSSPGSTGASGNGEVEDYIINISAPTTDFGDFSGFADASQGGSPSLRLGATTDTEYVSTRNATATGDDNTESDDEDGVTLPSMTAGQTLTIPVVASNSTGAMGYLNAWIDFNNNGSLTDSGEQIASNINVPTGSDDTTFNITLTVPTGAVTGTNIGARFRLSAPTSPGPTGANAAVGEIEDYVVNIAAPTTDTSDFNGFATATSTMNSRLRLGASVDAEYAATTNATATGDDITGTDDENGVTLPSLYAGLAATIPVVVTNTSGSTAFLNAWIDYNNNGVLTDPGEQIAINTTVATGTSNSTRNLSITVPASAVTGTNLGVRVRLTSVSSPGSTGHAGTGEVEDYVVNIIAPTADYGDWSGIADASNTVSASLRLGELADAEFSATKNATATGDDITGSDDEDGVTLPNLVSGGTFAIPVVVTNTSGAAAFLNAWIDLNNNGSFSDAGEQFATNLSVASGSDGVTLNPNLTIPTSVVTGTNLGMRFRLTATSSPGPTGNAGGNGEVEDYVTSISLPTTDLGDFSAFASASSTINSNLRLGALVDAEYAATTNANATGDDNTGSDDEDGVTLPSMMAGAPATIPVSVTNNTGSTAFLNAWIDFDGNGSLTDDGEQIATNVAITTGTTNGTQNLSITVPAEAVTGTPVGVRLRLTSVSSPGPVGAAGVGEVEDHVVTISTPPLDYGDWSGIANAASTANTNLRLGATVDTEFVPTRNAAATGDDNTGIDDEDGVVLPTLTAGAPATIPVVVTNITGGTAYLNAWIDYNNNGTLTDSGEQIATNVAITTGTTNGTQNLSITVPANAATGSNVGIRFRLTSVASPGVTGTIGTGEVEDYAVSIAVPTTDFSDWDGAATASSIASSNLRMGALADTEYAPTLNATATGDDISGSDDEDGVTIPSQTPGTAGSLSVVVTNNSGAAGYLNAWIDFNNNGSFADAGEQIATNISIATGTNGAAQTVNFVVPVDAVPGQRGARFRLTSTQNPTPVGASGTGEVEDHLATITCLPIALAPATLTTPTVGTAWSQTLTASGGKAPYTYTRGTGSLPAGLSLDSSGVISGTPTSSSSASFSVIATDAYGCTGTRSYTVTPVCPTISVNPATLPSPVTGTTYSQTLTGSGGTAPYSFTLASGTLPTWATLNSSGVLSGMPNSTTPATFTVRATDAYGCSGTQAFTLTPNCPAITVNPSTVADALVGSAYSQTLSASGGTGSYTFAVTSGSLPAGLTLNSSTGVVSGNPTTSNGAGTSLTFTATDANGCTGTRTVTLKVCPVISLAPATLTAPTVGTAWSQTITASGGAAPYTYSVSSGTLPSWATLSGAGILNGTANSTTTATVTVRATDANGCTGTRSYTIAPICPTITITPPSLAQGAVGSSYSQTLAASGGTAPYTGWTVTSGALPAGLSLNSSSGIISGTPTASASPSATVTVRATDAYGCQGSRAITLQICPTITLTPTTLSMTAGSSYSQTISGNGGTAAYVFAITSGSLPTGLSLNTATGAITGTPTSTSTVTFTLSATDANACTGTRSYTVTPACPVITVNPATLANGTVTAAYNQTVTASGGVGTCTFAISSGALPAGLSLNTTTGAITGTPTSSTAATFTVRATDTNGCTGTRSYTVTPACPTLTMTPATLPIGYLNAAYEQSFSISGGIAPYTYALPLGALPTGLSLSTSGIISGVPTVSGTYTFNLRATDSAGCSVTQSYVLNVRTLSVGDLVFEDSNNNGVRDAGEPGVAGATVQIFSTGSDNAIGGSSTAADTQIGSDVVTGSNGAYSFTGLVPGSYYVKVAPPADYLYTGGTPATTDNDVDNNNDGSQPGGAGTALFSPVFALSGGTESVTDGDTDSFTNYTIDFGLWSSVAVGNFIFLDINGDGIRNEGESLGDIYVELYAQGATPGVSEPVSVGSSGCSCKGRYYIDGLNPGSYFLHIPAAQFATGMPLEGLLPMSNVVAGDDNVGQDLLYNSNPALNGASTAVFTLRPGQCPVGTAESGAEGSVDDEIDARVDLTRDLGVVAPEGTGFAASERIRRHIITGGFTATVQPGATTFATWSQDGSIGSPTDDPDEDGLTNLLEYALGTDPTSPLHGQHFSLTRDSTTGSVIAHITKLLPTHDDVVIKIEGLADLSKASDPAAWKRVSLAPTTTINGDGTLTRHYANLERILLFKGLDTGFFRLKIELDADRDGVAEASATSGIHAWSRQTFATGARTFSMPLQQASVFTGRVSSINGGEVVLTSMITLPAGSHYLEVSDGPLAGQRFDIDTTYSSGNTLVLQNASQDLTGLVDARITIRTHHTLADLLPPAAFGQEDRVLFFDTAANNFTTLINGGDAWLGDALSMNARPFAAQEAALVQVRGTGAALMFTGEVRTNNFVTPLAAGTQLIAPGWPVSSAAPVTGLRSGSTPEAADRLRLWNGDISPELSSYTSYYLDHSTGAPLWKSQTGEPASAPQQNAFHGFFLIRETPLLLNQQAPW